jgi:N-acetylmuramoyl-L-alanine amidase
MKQQAGQHGKGMKAAGANAKTSPSAAPTTAARTSATSATAASAAPSVAATGATTNAAATGNMPAGGTTAHVEKQKVEQVKQQTAQIKQQHVNFKAQPRPDKAPSVQFNASLRIEGSDRWSGPQYEVFRSYHPERHERNWYHSRYTRIELIAGGYYYWNNGYWYPAWGYDPGAEYYAYDAPIYVGHRAEPPDRVIADVQAELQQMGYYQGEVDGLLGPLTRRALTDYQADQGLQVTAVIDEPTLDSLGMG